MSQSAGSSRRVVVVDGCRTPFCRSGTAFNDLTTYDLGRMAVAGLVQRTRVDPAAVDLLVMGTVIADPRTSNLGREVVLGTQLPRSCPAHTVSVACVSSLQAFLDCARAIATGAAEVAIAAGAETLSDAPIRFRRPVRKRLIASQRAKGLAGYAKLLKGLKLRDLLPEPVALAEFSTGEVMGANCERLAKRLGISREEQDALRPRVAPPRRPRRRAGAARPPDRPGQGAAEVPVGQRGQRGPWRLDARAAGLAAAGLRPPCRDGHRRQLLVPDRRRRGGAAGLRGGRAASRPHADRGAAGLGRRGPRSARGAAARPGPDPAARARRRRLRARPRSRCWSSTRPSQPRSWRCSSCSRTRSSAATGSGATGRSARSTVSASTPGEARCRSAIPSARPARD